MTKFIFVTGGVCSGLGKGITASSIALLLKQKGFSVFNQKLDPYMNVDPGTMSPLQHGEVFVTQDGCETDLDLGHYERFTDVELNYSSNVTNGKIYSNVIEKERKGDYLGATIQIIPHISNEIINKITEASISSKADFVITEIGGTVGDIESSVMLECLRQFKLLHPSDTMFVHTTLIPFLYGSNEHKTKPTQNSIIELRRAGLQPDMLVTRSNSYVGESIKKKIAFFGSLNIENIIEAVDSENIYEVPINMHNQNIEETILKHFNMANKKSNLKEWEQLIKTVNNLNNEVEIAIVGKYVALEDAYLSVKEALKHAGYAVNTKIKINWINSEDLEKIDINIEKIFKNVKGILVPGGFGLRGINGKILAIKYARENNIPFLGICLGMQLAAIEFARNVCGLKDATSTEFEDFPKTPIIDLMHEQKSINNMGGTLRLGNYECSINENTLAFNSYKETSILERHRHRYEFNNYYKEQLKNNGMTFSGINKNNNLVEIIEISNHKHFIAVQFHPEFKSRPTKAHPLFLSFIKASIK